MSTEGKHSHTDTNELLQRREKYFAGSYLFYKTPVEIVKGEGIWLFDKQGNCYLDCYNNVASVGHCHPKVVAALSEQAATLNTHTRYLNEKIINYSEHLASTMPTGLDVCLYTCTGTESNELAIRMARKITGNHGIIIMEHSYHGNSTLIHELSSCLYPLDECPDYVAMVEPPNTYRGSFRSSQSFNDAELAEKYANLIDAAIKKLVDAGHGVAAFICDAIFDSQGTLDAPSEYFKQVYEKVRAAGGLCIADEVQPGFGRLGEHMWGFEHYDVLPDIVTLGKPMGGGHPTAGVVTTREFADSFFQKAFYFNTFGGNPVSAAVAEAVLTVIEEEELQQNAHEVGSYLQDKLEKLAQKQPLIGDIRGRGLFFGVELVKDRETLEPAYKETRVIAENMKNEGVLIGSVGRFGNVIKIRPPLVFSKENADLLIEKLDKLLTEVN
ncbi:MAG: aminotransferase class III-fold pyridoxal phosphate-dependent enzyme [Deltaproteobacteria bacterium]|nr:aminotransferase class III-fold pyridoxal phosphate-dependent enzyme [Deltaproteobacteria bacterium]